MTTRTPKSGAKTGALSRDDKLKAALKANLARRKAQAKARAGETQAPRKTEQD